MNEALRWDGSTWKSVSVPNPLGTKRGEINELFGVACPDPSHCWAVGRAGTNPAVLRWNGSKWSSVSVPNPGDFLVRSIACTSGSDCWAVGLGGSGRSGSANAALRWDGSTWKLVSVPNPGGAKGSILQSVTCVAADDCWAIGAKDAMSRSTKNEALHWDGSSWTSVTINDPRKASSSGLAGVACVSSGDCWAVGGYGKHNEAVHWDGSNWKIVATPNPLSLNVLNGVACTSASDCWSVGTSVLRWNGSKWSTVL